MISFLIDFILAAGGSSDVGLYDLRFLDESSSVVQTYRPSCFPSVTDVAVSGIDISKDKKELLVSYENDQVSLSITSTFVIRSQRPAPLTFLLDLYLSNISIFHHGSHC